MNLFTVKNCLQLAAILLATVLSSQSGFCQDKVQMKTGNIIEGIVLNQTVGKVSFYPKEDPDELSLINANLVKKIIFEDWGSLTNRDLRIHFGWVWPILLAPPAPGDGYKFGGGSNLGVEKLISYKKGIGFEWNRTDARFENFIFGSETISIIYKVYSKTHRANFFVGPLYTTWQYSPYAGEIFGVRAYLKTNEGKNLGFMTGAEVSMIETTKFYLRLSSEVLYMGKVDINQESKQIVQLQLMLRAAYKIPIRK